MNIWRYHALLIKITLVLLLSSCASGRQQHAFKTAFLVKNTDTTHLDFTAEAAPEWDTLFDRTSGWFGADGIFSIPLIRHDGQASDSALFVFSDTMTGEIKDHKLQSGSRMLHNSVAYMKALAPDKKNIHFYYHNSEGKPATMFIPNTPHAQAGDYYWLGDGFVNAARHNNIYIFAYRMHNAGSGSWSFKQVGNALIVIPADDKPPFPNQRQIETPFLLHGNEEVESGSLGAGIFVNTQAAGAPDPDGYVYVYGVQGKEKNMIVARILPKDFETFDRWMFWDGHTWTNAMRKAAPVTHNVSNELSVSALPDGRYALVFQVGGMSDEIGLRLGLTPYGPFGPIIKVWSCRESQHKNYFTYNAKAHPALSKEGELLISYNVNAFDFLNEIRKNPNLYRPRFIRLKIK